MSGNIGKCIPVLLLTFCTSSTLSTMVGEFGPKSPHFQYLTKVAFWLDLTCFQIFVVSETFHATFQFYFQRRSRFLTSKFPAQPDSWRKENENQTNIREEFLSFFQMTKNTIYTTEQLCWLGFFSNIKAYNCIKWTYILKNLTNKHKLPCSLIPFFLQSNWPCAWKLSELSVFCRNKVTQFNLFVLDCSHFDEEP